MVLSAPSITGVLSVISKSVRVRGQYPGGEVEIFQNGGSIARHLTNGFDENYDLGGATLGAGDEITVSQRYNGDSSPRSPFPVIVQGLVAPFEGQRFISHIYRCGTSVFLGGVVPGATLEIRNRNGVVIGSTVSVDGGAAVELQAAIDNNEALQARQIVDGSTGGAVFSPPADPIPDLLKPIIEQPRACMTGIQVHAVMDGAEIEVQTMAGDPSSTISFKVSVSDLFLPLPMLSAGQKLQVREVLPRCERMGDPQDLVVEPMSFSGPPVVDGPLCALSVGFKVHGLTIGAELVATQGNTTLGRMIAFDADVDFWVNPLQATGEPLIVTESLCGVSTSSAVPVEQNPAQMAPCEIDTPLNNCALTIWVQNGRPGAMTAVFSDQRGQISPWEALAADGRINLSSALQAGHRISVIQNACGQSPVKSSNEPEVQRTPQLAAPQVAKPLFADPPTILVEGCEPGALVQVYSEEGGFLHSGIADSNGQVWVSHSTPFLTVLPRWHVYARQYLCAVISETGGPVEVQDRTPREPIINSPGIGQPDIDLRPHLMWTDPGENTVHQADRFLVEVTTPDHPLYDAVAFKTVGNFTSVTVDHDLVSSTRYIWRITPAVGDPGWELAGPAANGSFVTKAAVAPGPTTPPHLSSLTHGSAALHYVVKGNAFLPSAVVHFRITAPTLQSEFVNEAADGSQIKSDQSGGLSVEIALPNLSSAFQHLYFQANDGRPDPTDLATHTLWSNTLNIER